MVTISGYSLTGVLEDCEIPPKIYPLQSDNLSLKQIAQKIIAPFGLKMIVDSSVESLMNSSFKKSTAKEKPKYKKLFIRISITKEHCTFTHTTR